MGHLSLEAYPSGEKGSLHCTPKAECGTSLESDPYGAVPGEYRGLHGRQVSQVCLICGISGPACNDKAKGFLGIWLQEKKQMCFGAGWALA